MTQCIKIIRVGRKTMKTKFYFQHNDSEMCMTRAYFDNYMEQNKLTKMEVFEAKPIILGNGIFWCKKHSFCGEDTKETCGTTNCEAYTPRNKINGVCKHHTRWFYTYGNKITINSKNMATDEPDKI